MVEGMSWLEGFLRTDKGVSIVTSQRLVQGKKATAREVRRYFEVVASNGVILPVDVIPVRPIGCFLERIKVAVSAATKKVERKS